jgi:hypothetical protein
MPSIEQRKAEMQKQTRKILDQDREKHRERIRDGYPVRMQSVAPAPRDRKGSVEGEHCVNGTSGPRIVIRVDLVPVGDFVKVEVRITAYP